MQNIKDCLRIGGIAILDLTFISKRNVLNYIMNSSTIINTYEDNLFLLVIYKNQDSRTAS